MASATPEAFPPPPPVKSAPPPTRTSRLVCLVFGVSVLLCVPLWWLTSKITRESLARLETSPLEFQIPVQLLVSTSVSTHVDAMEMSLTPAGKMHSMDISVKKTNLRIPPSLALEDLDDYLLSHTQSTASSPKPGHFTGFMLDFDQLGQDWIKSRKIKSFHWYMGEHQHAWMFISDGAPMMVSVNHAQEFVRLLKQRVLFSPTGKTNDRLSAESDVSLSFTLLNADPSQRLFQWDFRNSFDALLAGFFTKLNPIVHTEIDSQTRYYGSISSQAVRTDKAGGKTEHYLSAEDLQSFVGNTKWNVESTRTTSPAIEFLVFVPPADQTPLVIRTNRKRSEESTLSFTVPRWGAVTIWNPPEASSPRESEIFPSEPEMIASAHMTRIMSTFIQQTREMLGVPPLIQKAEEFTLVTNPNGGISDWEVDALMFHRIKQNLADIETTLTSLYELIEKVTHLPIEKNIQHLVGSAVESYQKAHEACRKRDFSRCLEHSHSARSHAREAFFDPNMMPALFFSQEFTLAVYLPFFLPAFMPVVAVMVAALKTEFTLAVNLPLFLRAFMRVVAVMALTIQKLRGKKPAIE